MLIHIILIATGSYFAEMFFPWWTAVVVAFVVLALLPTSSPKAFLAGFLGLGLLWLAGALLYSFQTDFILTAKVASLLQARNSAVLIILTAVLGGIAGGMGALSGNHLNLLLHQPPRRKWMNRY